MADTFLTEDDYVFQSDNDLLRQKADAITKHTDLLLLDLDDEDIVSIENAESLFLLVKDMVFTNTDRIVQSNEGDAEEAALKEKQAELLDEWKNFGFTEGFFYDMYNVERGLLNTELDEIERERLELLKTILNAQQTLVVAFNVVYSKDETVLLDIDDYM